MSDPHADDYCVVCGNPPTVDGPMVHPVASIKNGVICDTHVSDRINA